MKLLKVCMAALIFATFACGPDKEAAAEKERAEVAAAAEYAKVALENDHVAVTLVSLPSGAGLPMHSGQERLVYSLSDYKLQYHPEDGEPQVSDHRKGSVHWHAADTHAVRNVGATKAEFLIVARKSPNPTPGVTSNLVELAPNAARIAFENEKCKVIEVTLKAGEKEPAHVAASRVIYSFTPATLKFTSEGQTSDVSHAAGEVHYHAGGEHSVQNVGAEEVRYLVVELM